MDRDHVSPGSHDPARVWKAFTRGHPFSLYDQPFEQPQNESSAWQGVRANIRQACLLSGRVADMSQMRPRADRILIDLFALDVIKLCGALPQTLGIRHAIGQVIRSSSSTAANKPVRAPSES